MNDSVMPFRPGLKGDGSGRRYFEEDTDAVYHSKLFKHLKIMATETQEQIQKIAQEWGSIQEVMDFAVKHVKTAWVDAHENSPQWLNELRGIRMALATELKQIHQSINDIREATEGPEAQKRKQELTQLVELCERFRAVQKDGTFDAVVAALLKH